MLLAMRQFGYQWTLKLAGYLLHVIHREDRLAPKATYVRNLLARESLEYSEEYSTSLQHQPRRRKGPKEPETTEHDRLAPSFSFPSSSFVLLSFSVFCHHY